MLLTLASFGLIVGAQAAPSQSGPVPTAPKSKAHNGPERWSFQGLTGASTAAVVLAKFPTAKAEDACHEGQTSVRGEAVAYVCRTLKLDGYEVAGVPFGATFLFTSGGGLGAVVLDMDKGGGGSDPGVAFTIADGDYLRYSAMLSGKYGRTLQDAPCTARMNLCGRWQQGGGLSFDPRLDSVELRVDTQPMPLQPDSYREDLSITYRFVDPAAADRL